MLKIKKVVETEVELPAPDSMTLVWRNATFSDQEFIRAKTIAIGKDVYQATSLETWREEEYNSYRLPDVFMSVGLQKVNAATKGNK